MLTAPYTRPPTLSIMGVKKLIIFLTSANSSPLLEIEIKSNDGLLNIRTFKKITILPREIYPLIQTDKGHYKAKDEVKFRILLLDHDLKPVQDLKSVDEIWVEDPRNRRIAQWKDAVCCSL